MLYTYRHTLETPRCPIKDLTSNSDAVVSCARSLRAHKLYQPRLPPLCHCWPNAVFLSFSGRGIQQLPGLLCLPVCNEKSLSPRARLKENFVLEIRTCFIGIISECGVSRRKISIVKEASNFKGQTVEIE